MARQLEALNGVDAAWLRMETPTNLMVVNALLRFDAPLTYDELVELVEDRLLRFKRFRQRVVHPKRKMGRPHWEEDPTFDVASHVQRVALPSGGTPALKRWISDRASQPLDASKPLWRLYLLEGVGESNAIFARVHHSLADGFSLLFIMSAMVDPDCPITFPAGITAPELGTATDDDVEQIAGPLRRSLLPKLPDLEKLVAQVGELADPAALSRGARDVGGAAVNAAQLLTMPPEADTPLRGPLGTRKLVGWTEPVPIDDVKRIGAGFGGTVNDVLLLALTDAVRRFCDASGHAIDARDIRVAMPVNIRPMERRSEDLGNGFGLVFIELPIGEPDPAERLATLQRRIEVLKKSPEAFVTFGVLTAMGASPAAAQAQLLRLFYNKATAIATNVPGPIEPVRIGGRAIERITFWVPQSADLGLGFSIFSYRGEVQVGIHGDANLLPDPDLFAACFHDAFDALLSDC